MPQRYVVPDLKVVQETKGLGQRYVVWQSMHGAEQTKAIRAELIAQQLETRHQQFGAQLPERKFITTHIAHTESSLPFGAVFQRSWQAFLSGDPAPAKQLQVAKHSQ